MLEKQRFRHGTVNFKDRKKAVGLVFASSCLIVVFYFHFVKKRKWLGVEIIAIAKV